jgi:hypothetical protein
MKDEQRGVDPADVFGDGAGTLTSPNLVSEKS